MHDMQHADCVAALIREGGASFLANESGNTPLHWAAVNGRLPVAKLLLEHFNDGTDAGTTDAGTTDAGTTGAGTTDADTKTADTKTADTKTAGSGGGASAEGGVGGKKAGVEKGVIDVLKPNGFGQGALTEAFKSGNTDLVAL